MPYSWFHYNGFLKVVLRRGNLNRGVCQVEERNRGKSKVRIDVKISLLIIANRTQWVYLKLIQIGYGLSDIARKVDLRFSCIFSSSRSRNSKK